jgi:DNA helicase HerA-like ATPase
MLDDTALSNEYRLDQVVEPLPRVIGVNGAQTEVGLPKAYLDKLEAMPPTVGKFLGIRRASSLLIGMIVDVAIAPPAASRDQGFHATAHLDLLGEIASVESPRARFQRGVTNYPAIGDPALMMTSREAALVYDISGGDTINIGTLHQDATIGAVVNVDDLLNKHFALLGTTGVGKSSGLALILRRILEVRPQLRMFVLDGHNEYGHCFGDRANVLNPRNLKLPFWLFNFEELVEVLFGGRTGADEEVTILSEAIPLAKGAYAARAGVDRSVRRADPKSTGFTVDTPVPYRLDDLLGLIDERMGRLENRASRLQYFKLISRIETVRNDPRYAFMFDNANVGGDTMADVLRQLFRLQPDGKAMTVMQLGGFPAEVIDSVVSVLCRMAFDFGLWSDGAVPLLFVCEEAHRYASADRSTGFGPTRRALLRIAKEGRKYGVFLALVTQRPAELDATIISQCSTLFAMRMANERDQALLRSAVPDAGANLLAFISSLGTREVLAFGEGVALPARLKFGELAFDQIPRSEAVSSAARKTASDDFIDAAIERWRGATMSIKRAAETDPGDGDPRPAGDGASRLSPDRYRLLKRSTDAPAEAAASSPQRTLK